MSHGAAEVDQAALGQDNDVAAVFQQVAVNLSRGGSQLWRSTQPTRPPPPFYPPSRGKLSYLGLDVDLLCIFVEPAYIKFAVKVSDVAHDSVVLHFLKVAEGRKLRSAPPAGGEANQPVLCGRTVPE